jgi:hypothetical protein
MTIEDWLREALADADRRKLPDLKPLLEALARSTKALRDANVTGDLTGQAGDERTNGLGPGSIR